MRHRLVLLVSAGWLVGMTPAARAQLSFDARRTGMGGVSLGRDGTLGRFNPAYQAVPARQGRNAKFTIPIPLGLFQVLKDSTAFDFDSSYFNPIKLTNYIFHPPLFLEVKKSPTPDNDVEFTIGRDSLIVDLGKASQLVPTDRFGFGGTSRLADIGFTIKGFHVGALIWEEHDIGFQLGDTLLMFLRQKDPARTNTVYNSAADGVVQTGFAPTLGYAGRVWGDSLRGVYLGASLHYYLGVTYAGVEGVAGFRTGDTLFAGSNPVSPTVDALVSYSQPGHSFGHGFGTDLGIVYVTGPIEVGFGVNDIGATLTWADTRVDRDTFDTAANKFQKTVLDSSASTKTKLPVTYVANAVLDMGTNTTAGMTVLNNGRGTTIQVGVEQRVGPLALRGGVQRDQRKRVQIGWGTGVRFGSFGLDVGFATHSGSLSTARGITMASSISIY